MAQPTFVGPVVKVAYTGAGALTKTSASFSVNANDVLVVPAASSDANTALSGISGGSLTWTQQQLVSVSQFAVASVWTAIVDVAKSMTVTVTAGNTANIWGFDVIKYSGSSGIGASSKANVSNAAPSLALTTTQANSTIVTLAADWNAVDGASRIWRTVNGVTPTAGNGLELDYGFTAGQYTAYLSHVQDAGAVGAQTLGLSAPAGQKYSIIAVEIKGTAGTVTPPPHRGWGIPLHV